MIILIKSFIFSIGALSAAGNKWEYKLFPSSLSAGQRAILEVRLDVPAGTPDDDTPTVSDEWLTESNQIQILDKTFHRENEKWVWRYEITGYKAGRVSVPPLLVSFKGETFSTERSFLTISTTRSENDLDLRPDFGAIRPPIQWRYWIKMMISGILFFITLIGVERLVRYLRARRKEPPPPVRTPAPVENPFEWLRRQLIIYRQELERPAFEAKAVDRLTEIVREFFTRKNGKPCLCWTTQEFKRLLSTDTLAQGIFPVLLLCDQFKFLPTKCSDVKSLAQSVLIESEKILLSHYVAI